MAFKVGYWPGELGNAPHEPYMQKRIGVRSLFSCWTIKTIKNQEREAYQFKYYLLFYCSSVEISERLFKYDVRKGSCCEFRA